MAKQRPVSNPEPAAPSADDAPPVAATPPAEIDECLVVGIGSSAGGLEAITELLANLPQNTGAAFVVVQHLDPHHSSALPSLLQKSSTMPVLEARDGQRVQPNHVYTIAPNSQLRISHGQLRVATRPEGRDGHFPVDAFFVSLATHARENAVGVILSGNATDGTAGLRAIKAEGGTIFAQEGARFDGMPRSAKEAGVVDRFLSPAQIAQALAEFTRTGQRRVADKDESETVGRILGVVRERTGVDFSQYKQPTIQRRLFRRMALREARSISAYLTLLQDDPGEARLLGEDFLINATGFFRDPSVFERLKETALPSIVAGRLATEPIRVWVPGCSTGEEVYTIAICLVEFLESAALYHPVQIFGTDVSGPVVEKARLGIYQETALQSVSPERLRRFFMRANSGYQIRREIREMCIFAQQNVAQDPPLSRMDLISCRNLLIYLGTGMQRRVFTTFANALRPAGCLLLGTSETPGTLAGYFIELDKGHRIYRLRSDLPPSNFDLPSHIASDPTPAVREVPERAQPQTAVSVEDQVDDVLLEQAPACVVVDNDYRVAAYRGPVAPYLKVSSRELGVPVFHVIRDDMALHLRGAIENARSGNLTVRLTGVHYRENARVARADLTVTPLGTAGAGRHYAILLAESPFSLPGRQGPDSEPADKRRNPKEYAAALEQELESTRQYLQSIIEELRSTNEEVQSSNEELQSTNEELQTAQEELQSSNEELQTLNAEMHARNSELAQVNDDLINVLTSLSIPILMLDNSMRIRRFTPVSAKALHLIPSDVGRPVIDLKPRLNVPDLEVILQQVHDTLVPFEREVRDIEGRWHTLRVRPYRTSNNRIDGVVLQLVEVDQLKRALDSAEQARQYAESIIETVRHPLLVLDQSLRIHTANGAVYSTFSLTAEKVVGHDLFEAGNSLWDVPELRKLLESARRGYSPGEEEVEQVFSRLPNRTFQLNARRIDQAGLILLGLEDVTERKRAAEARYRRLFESAKDGILIVNAESTKIEDVNPCLVDMLGYPREDLLEKHLAEVDCFSALLPPSGTLDPIREKELVKYPDVTLHAPDGQEVQVEAVANAYAEKEQVMIQFNLRDVTERRRFERQLQHAQKLESLGVLAGGIAHDFNNLLTGILGNASLALADAPSDYSQRRYLKAIVDSSERAAELTRQILAYSGKGRFLVEPLDISQIIRDTRQMIQSSIPKTVEVHLDLLLNPPTVRADAAQVQQIVMNLIINGAEAVGDGRIGIVSASTRVRELGEAYIRKHLPHSEINPGSFLCIEVTDNGCGMDPETQSKIFDPFFTTKFTGRGLGLAAAQGIVRTMHGAIEVSSTPGRGTSFKVFLPITGEPLRGISQEPTRDLNGTGAILFVDDERTIRSVAKTGLEKAGYRVLLAENGLEAVQQMGAHTDEIVLAVLDLKMPVMGGEAAVPKLRAIRESTPILISSGHDETEAMERLTGNDVAGFLQKPYTVKRLLEAVKAAIEKSIAD